jgi:hypothetical protein
MSQSDHFKHQKYNCQVFMHRSKIPNYILRFSNKNSQFKKSAFFGAFSETPRTKFKRHSMMSYVFELAYAQSFWIIHQRES